MLGFGICIPRQEGDRCTSGFSFKNTGEDFKMIFLFPFGRKECLPGPAAVQFRLNEIQVNTNQGRKSIQDATDGRPMRLTEGG